MRPFDDYPNAGKALIKFAKGASCRREYGNDFMQATGQTKCAYCGLDLTESFENWLTMTLDHVVPSSVCKQLGIRREWEGDFINMVLSCSACNGFENRYKIAIDQPAPHTLKDFCALRDKIFAERMALILNKRKGDRQFFLNKNWLKPEHPTRILQDFRAQITSQVEALGIIPRSPKRYPFDFIATSMMSRAAELFDACLLLVDTKKADDAFGLSRSIVEASLVLRYLTADPHQQTQRSIQFLDFSLDYKNLWLYLSLKAYAGKPEEAALNRYAAEMHLSGDPTLAYKHWSEIRNFTKEAEHLIHPLDGTEMDEELKKKLHAIDYFQACQWVHCSVISLENYVPEDNIPFVFSNSVESVWPTSKKTFHILVVYLYTTIIYSLYGMNVDRPDSMMQSYIKARTDLEAVDAL